MNPSFEGFEVIDNTSPTQVQPNTVGSDYETTVESTGTTPTNSNPSQGTSTVRRSGSRRQSVRQLVGHFSNSDSDSTEQNIPSKQRKKSKTGELLELPLGGERQLKKRMAAQAQADDAIDMWTALSLLLKDTLDEADKALSDNDSRASLIGYAEAVKQADSEVKDAWKEVESFKGNANVTLTYMPLMVKMKKQQSRCNKIKGHIAAQTEIPILSTPGSSVMRVIQPMSFGSLVLPDFSGDYTAFDGFEGLWKSLIKNGNLDEGGKVAHLLRSLKGEAKDYIGTDGLSQKSYDEIWTDLRDRYGKPWRVTRSAVRKIMDIRDPTENPTDITRYWNQMMEACKIAERQKLTAPALILNMALLKLPVDFRAKMDDKLKPICTEYILTRELVAEPFNDIIAGEVERPNNVIATVGFNTAARPTGNKQQSVQPKQTGYGPDGQEQHFSCMLCGKRRKGSHKTWFCPTYNTGLLAKDRMRSLGRCPNCATIMTEHGNECSHRVSCRDHPGQRHVFWLCANYLNFTYKSDPMPQQQLMPQQQWQQYPQQQQQQQQYRPPNTHVQPAARRQQFNNQYGQPQGQNSYNPPPRPQR